MSKYDFDNAGGNDFDNNPNLKMEPPCKVRATLDSVFVSNSPFGQSLGINLTDAKLVDGIYTVPLKDDNNDPAKPQNGGEPDHGSPKVLSWEDEQTQKILNEDSVEEIMEEPYLQRNYVGTNYYYDVEKARLEEDPDADYPSQPEEEVELGDLVFFTGSTKNGAKSKSKTLAKILTEQGRDAVVDEDSQDAWLDEDVALRSDLMGKEVVIAMTQKKSDESGHTFHHPYVLDGKTNAPIFVDNSAESEEETEEEEEEEDDENDVPSDVQSFFDTCSELNITNEEAVSGLLTDMKQDDDIDPDQIDEFGGDDAVIEAVAN